MLNHGLYMQKNHTEHLRHPFSGCKYTKKNEIESFERKKMLTSPKLTLRKASQAFFFSSTWSLLLLCHIRSIMNVTFSTTKMAKMCKCANCKTFFLN